MFNTIDKVELLKIFWYLYYKFPYLGDKRADISKTIQRLFQNFFLEKNNDGNTCMSISLEKNFIKIEKIIFNHKLSNNNTKKWLQTKCE